MTVEVNYKCNNCGFCCNKLLIDRQGVRKGLPLLPEETEVFEAEFVKPAIALGDSLDDIEVILYQLTLNSCPYRTHGGCSIWVYRPTICRAYPVLPVITTGNRVVLSYDFACSALEKYRDVYPGNNIPWNYSSIAREAKNARKLSEVTLRALENVDRAWFYDLASDGWVTFSRLLGV